MPEYHGYERLDMKVDGCAAMLVAPVHARPGRPWIWRAEFFDEFPEVDLALLARGFHLAYIAVGDTWGCPDALDRWDVFYQHLTRAHGLGSRPALEGLSRGGLYIYNWAVRGPERVGCLYGDAPVCDFRSAPGGMGRSERRAAGWQAVLDSYHFQSEAEALAYRFNPVDNLTPLARARVPIIHVYGDADDIVPFEENTALVQERYARLGGEMTVIAKPGVGHHPHGLPDPSPIVEFIVGHCG